MGLTITPKFEVKQYVTQESGRLSTHYELASSFRNTRSLRYRSTTNGMRDYRYGTQPNDTNDIWNGAFFDPTSKWLHALLVGLLHAFRIHVHEIIQHPGGQSCLA
jgi:hypothetical protein